MPHANRYALPAGSQSTSRWNSTPLNVYIPSLGASDDLRDGRCLQQVSAGDYLVSNERRGSTQ